MCAFKVERWINWLFHLHKIWILLTTPHFGCFPILWQTAGLSPVGCKVPSTIQSYQHHLFSLDYCNVLLSCILSYWIGFSISNFARALLECSSHAFVRPAGDVQFDVCHLFVLICVCRVNEVGSWQGTCFRSFRIWLWLWKLQRVIMTVTECSLWGLCVLPLAGFTPGWMWSCLCLMQLHGWSIYPSFCMICLNNMWMMKRIKCWWLLIIIWWSV